jgi:predicted ATP-binding protein involved in virulence
MKKSILKIEAKKPFTDHKIEIHVNGLNLIITGGNGSGKTSLVKAIYSKLRYLLIDRGGEKADQTALSRGHWKKTIETAVPHSHEFMQARRQLDLIDNALAEKVALPLFVFNDLQQLHAEINDGKGIVEIFEAYRQANIVESRSASSIHYDPQELKNTSTALNIGDKLEAHLVNLHTRSVFAINESKNIDLYNSISSWFASFRKNLQYLLEDNSANVVFDADKFKFFIHQKNKSPYTFQTLSSGYSSIFAILSRLLMRAEYLRLSPSDLSGLVIIDEIDAHLHVSLQKKILPFLNSNFPNLQFIVTTHSPFVLSSVTDAIIYDLTKDEQVNDLSSYSYGSILEAVFGVLSTSNLLEGRLSEMAKIVDSIHPDYARLQELLELIAPDVDRMDEESQFFVNKAIYLVSRNDELVKKNV